MLHFTFVTTILCRQWRALMFCFNSCDSDVNSCSSGRQAVWCSFYSTISPVTNTCKLTSISLWDSKEWYLLNYVKNLKNLHLSFREWKEIKTTMNISSTTKIKAVTKVAPPPWIPAISIISVQAKTTPTAVMRTVQMQRLLSARAVMENCVLLSQSPAVVHNSVAGFQHRHQNCFFFWFPSYRCAVRSLIRTRRCGSKTCQKLGTLDNTFLTPLHRFRI